MDFCAFFCCCCCSPHINVGLGVRVGAGTQQKMAIWKSIWQWVSGIKAGASGENIDGKKQHGWGEGLGLRALAHEGTVFEKILCLPFLSWTFSQAEEDQLSWCKYDGLCSGWIPAAVLKHWPNQHGEERVYLVHASTSQLITEGSQRKNLKAALSVLGTNSQPRKYSRTHRVPASSRLTCRFTYS